ncbi:MAG: response regulator, partial [Rhodospirillaceae bacterium]
SLHRLVRHRTRGAEQIHFEMSPITGIDFIRIVRAFDTTGASNPEIKNHNVPILVVTGHAQQELVLAVTKAGANGVLVKPVSPAVLKARIEATLKNRP